MNWYALFVLIPSGMLLLPFYIWLSERKPKRRWRHVEHIERLERECFPDWFEYRVDLGQKESRPRYRELVLDLPPKTWD